MSVSDFAMIALLVACLGFIAVYVVRFGDTLRQGLLIAPSPDGTELDTPVEPPVEHQVPEAVAPAPRPAPAPSVYEDPIEVPERKAA